MPWIVSLASGRTNVLISTRSLAVGKVKVPRSVPRFPFVLGKTPFPNTFLPRLTATSQSPTSAAEAEDVPAYSIAKL
jgi:hypothetical protein